MVYDVLHISYIMAVPYSYNAAENFLLPTEVTAVVMQEKALLTGWFLVMLG